MFWQFTERARVPGINRFVDMDVFNGNSAKFRLLTEEKDRQWNVSKVARGGSEGERVSASGENRTKAGSPAWVVDSWAATLSRTATGFDLVTQNFCQETAAGVGAGGGENFFGRGAFPGFCRPQERPPGRRATRAKAISWVTNTRSRLRA